MLDIVHIPEKVLYKTAKPVQLVDKKIRKIIDEMKKTLVVQKNPEGVGLAAPQVGYSLRIFIMKPTKKSPITVCINPEIQSLEQFDPLIKDKKSGSVAMEGCLSIPLYWSEVARSQKLTLRYLDEEGHEVMREFTGFEAVIVQHEVDHLNGTLFITRALEQQRKIYLEEPDGTFVPVELE